MTDSGWRTDGSACRIERGGRNWVLSPELGWPGLESEDDGPPARLLGLHSLCMAGHQDDGAFRATLIASDCRRGRVEATYNPAGWGGLSVRAAWEPTRELEGFDLEIQVSAASPGLIRRFEVVVESAWPVVDDAAAHRYVVEPRDRVAAASTYDGREPPSVLGSLITMPVPLQPSGRFEPMCTAGDQSAVGSSYAEMIQPNDCARRVVLERAAATSSTQVALWCRHGLFGHDIERGVVLRGRMRGIWIPATAPPEELRRCHESFSSEPPPLGP